MINKQNQKLEEIKFISRFSKMGDMLIINVPADHIAKAKTFKRASLLVSVKEAIPTE